MSRPTADRTPQSENPAPESLAPDNAARGEGYLDIVWGQFKKHTFAYLSLWMLAPIFLLAIFAPVIASNQPFVFYDGDTTLFPWFRAIFNPNEPVDYFFNMAMIAFLPWVVCAAVSNWRWKKRGMPGRDRVLYVSFQYFVAIIIVTLVFMIPGIRPNNRYFARQFVREEFKSPERHGIYPPIRFGAIEGDLPAAYQPPMYRKTTGLLDVNDGELHWMGTDDIGRDVLVRMLYGTRISMSVGFVAVTIYMTIGVIVGALAGYFGGITDIVISRVIEVVLLFPAFFLILTLVAMIGPSIYMIMVVIGLTRWPTIARLIRGEVLKQRSIDYTYAARALGSSDLRIIFRHILPNSLSPALVSAPFGIAGAIILEAGLSLLGFGVRAPTPTWGILLKLGNSNYEYWWLIVIPSLAMFFTVTIFNLVGSGLRDAMDPRLRV